MPVGAGIGAPSGFALFDDVGKDVDFGVSRQQGIPEYVLFKRSKMAGEVDLLGGGEILIGKDQDSVLGDCPRHFGDEFRSHRRR